MTPRVSTLYRARVAAGALAPDPVQDDAARRLDELAEALSRARGGWFGAKAPSPRGLYIWGPVGRGKSMLMDLFFEAAPLREKRRVHFHEFMLERHAFLREARAREEGQDKLIEHAAKQAAAEARLLCLDELQISDIADAMLVGRLFERLFERDVTIVTTSNRPPKDLYKNGLNRQLFLPFIALIEARLDILELAAERDYRLDRLVEAPTWHAPLGPLADHALSDAWRRLTQGAQPIPTAIETQGRRWVITCSAAGCARLSFDELCRRPLGAADYLEVAQRFHTVLIDHIPLLGPSDREAAARFRTLIDALYESKTKLVASAAAEPGALYAAGEQAFEFERTASRLMEMRSRDYLAAPRRDAEFARALADT